MIEIKNDPDSEKAYTNLAEFMYSGIGQYIRNNYNIGFDEYYPDLDRIHDHVKDAIDAHYKDDDVKWRMLLLLFKN
jgi:hypothetical protein